MSSITKYTELTLAGVTGLGIALLSGTTQGIFVGASFLCEGSPHHAFGSFWYTIYDKERNVVNATRSEFSKTDYSIKNIFISAL